MPCSFTGNSPVSYSTPTTNGQNTDHNTPTSLVPPNAYAAQGSSNNASTPGSSSDQAGDAVQAPSPLQPQPFGHLDLELIHYYCTQTYMTMTSRLTAHLVWRDVVFREALKHNFLLSALMATAALHKATNHAEDSDIHATYIRVAFQYQNAALAGYIPALGRPSEDNAVALFILSALLTIWLFGSKKLPEALNGVKNFLPYMMRTSTDHEPTDFLEILTLVQGINAVVAQTFQWLRGGEIDPLLSPPQEHELPPNPPDIEESFRKLRERINGTNAHNRGLSEVAAKQRMEIYNERLDNLRKVSRARTVLEHDQQVFAWPVTSDSPFIELIRQREPTAIALFIHWAACFRCLDHLWWAKGWSYRLVKGASPLLDESWADVLTWPKKEVGLE